MDDDGRAETLRLLFATPRHWLRDGAGSRIERAPTAFGASRSTAYSELAAGRVTADVEMPSRSGAGPGPAPPPPARGVRITSALAGGRPLPMADPETLDLSGLSGRVRIEATVRGRRPG